MKSSINGRIYLAVMQIFVSIIALFCVGACAESRLRRSVSRSDLVVEAEVVGMQGACSIFGCPWIQYKIDLDKIVENNSMSAATDAELQNLNICGASGLILGMRYKFYLNKPPKELFSASRHPRTIDGDYAQCDFILLRKKLLSSEDGQAKEL